MTEVKNEIKLFIDKIVKERNYIVVKDYTDSRIKMVFITHDGYWISTKLRNLYRGSHPQIFGISNPYTIINIKNFIDINNLSIQLVSDTFISIREKLIFRCSCGNEYPVRLDAVQNFKQLQCRDCGFKIGKEKRRKYNNKSVDETLSRYLRAKIIRWKCDSMFLCEYKCAISNEIFDQVHHIYSFSLILDEFLNSPQILKIDNNINPYSDIKIYTIEQLKTIEEIFIKIHNKYPLGVCLTLNIHKEFHNIYGNKYNTVDQWIEFYKAKTNKSWNIEYNINDMHYKKKQTNYDLYINEVIKLHKEGYTKTKISIEIGFCIETILKWIKKYKRENPECTIFNIRNHYNNREIICVTTNKTYKSITDASNEIGVSINAIMSCCKNKTNSSGLHQFTKEPLVWMYLEDYNKYGSKEYITPKNLPKMVKCITTDTVYKSIAEAERQTGIANRGIITCCKNKRKSAGKMIIDGEKVRIVWEYYKEKQTKSK